MNQLHGTRMPFLKVDTCDSTVIDLPEKLAEVIDRALREEPALFYSSADDFRRDIIETLPDDVRSCCREIL